MAGKHYIFKKEHNNLNDVRYKNSEGIVFYGTPDHKYGGVNLRSKHKDWKGYKSWTAEENLVDITPILEKMLELDKKLRARGFDAEASEVVKYFNQINDGMYLTQKQLKKMNEFNGYK